ncbi:unnamed protein product [Psylliodes chrysocephalus]|uniref:Uncharacterized protein n=1 Tax=Psylliodes chrysocephalus TaxID=3402493 RepID=A0A9P0CV31_9CUCU|nr:unnamed protein product [Psylliodes chrysocephala]
MDMQAVFLEPKSNVSALYYKIKLAVIDFTFYDLKTEDESCFVCNESEGGLTASVYASNIMNFLARGTDKHQVPYIIYSYGCTSRNRNVTLSNALLNLALFLKNITIFQKYLERGHIQMKCDSMHSTIERQIKNAIINVSADCITIFRAARKNPSPYKVEYLNHQFFKDISSLQYYPSIRPRTSVTVNCIRQLRYD